jgi:hypothetical protein
LSVGVVTCPRPEPGWDLTIITLNAWCAAGGHHLSEIIRREHAVWLTVGQMRNDVLGPSDVHPCARDRDFQVWTPFFTME